MAEKEKSKEFLKIAMTPSDLKIVLDQSTAFPKSLDNDERWETVDITVARA
jgi:hypothetical protein